MQVDLQALTVVKRLSEELTKQRDIAQADNLVMRNDRKHAEEWAKSLERRIKATSTYLDTTRRREALVCQEGQLRVEAVACLPPLILESLLRGYHGVGFLQHASVPETDSDLQTETPEVSLVLLECMAEISRLLLNRKSTLSTLGGKSNSVVGRSNSVVIGLPFIVNIEQPLSPQAAVIAAVSATTGNAIGRRAGGAVSQDELSGRAFTKLFSSLRERIQTSDAKVLFTQSQDFTTEKQWSQHENAALAREYQQLLRAIRYQDEHYASHSKLFSSRMLESHEISLVPNQSMPNVIDGFAGSDTGDLGVINGVKRFWKPILPVQKPKSPPSRSQLRRMPTRMQSKLSLKEQPQPPPLLLENLSLIDEADFDISSLHSRGFSILLLAHFATEYGALLFSPADMSAFTHNAYMNPPAEKVKAEDVPSPAQSSTSLPPADESIPASDAPTEINNSLRIIQPIVTAYNTWNEISEQLISAGVVQSRAQSVADPSHEGSEAPPEVQRIALATPIRPMLKHQFEPLSHSSFLAPAREKNGRRTSFTSGDGNTYHSAHIRHLTAEGTDKLAQSIDAIHKSVKVTTDKMKDFRATSLQLRDLRVTQWQQATELALQLAAKEKVTSVPVVADGGDHREHVYECISLVNSTMRRIFSVEENPEMELSSVTDVFEKYQGVVRQLYTPFRANIKHAMSLDDMWHIVKIIRLPREIHVLPVLRDEELVANGYEQLFSPEDLAELFLQLCNEQFQPQITPLSSRVEYFITHHLTIALQNQSLLRPIMHRSDVKLAINSHSQTIRIIFRRYCAKERELMMPAVGATKPKPRHTGHGITKYMRMVDWQAFVQDYHLIRARLSMEQALAVFRNVQEAPLGSDDQLELIYSEFCEALVGVASFYFPNPFIKTASKVTQFLRRYLPLSPEDAHDHA
ncbi:hypothetical protein DVH05_008952 [Phytophthora capsici]|nr:hypothetical protein DVH05_008952 [Phytophthora capsici]